MGGSKMVQSQQRHDLGVQYDTVDPASGGGFYCCKFRVGRSCRHRLDQQCRMVLNINLYYEFMNEAVHLSDDGKASARRAR